MTIGRREFITLLGGAAAWPLAARAQQVERMRRIGVLLNVAEKDPVGQGRLSAFVQRLKEVGWTDGHASTFAGAQVTMNCTVDTRRNW
jgi:putative ABC transport system substrate-binding protein